MRRRGEENPAKHAKREIQKKKAAGSAHLAARLCAGGLDGKDGALGIFILPQGREGLGRLSARATDYYCWM